MSAKEPVSMDDYCQGIGDVYEHLSEVGLPNNSKIRQFTANNSCVSDYDEAYTELFTWLKIMQASVSLTVTI